MALYLIAVSIAGGSISLVSFVGLCNSILMLRDPDPDKKQKSKRILMGCLGFLAIGILLLRNPEILHPRYFQAAWNWLAGIV